MKNRFLAASTLVCALVCVSDPALSLQQRAQPQECGNLAQYIPRLSQEFGWTREQAIGALANFAHESRGRAIEQIGTRAGTGGFGWAQWTGARRYAFMTFARTNRMSPATDAANYAFLAHELRTTFAHVAQRMRTARSAAEATVIFARDYEGAFGPGAVTALASRHQWARALGAMSVVPTAARPVVAAAAPLGAVAAATTQRSVPAAPVRPWYALSSVRPVVTAPATRPWYRAAAQRPAAASVRPSIIASPAAPQRSGVKMVRLVAARPGYAAKPAWRGPAVALAAHPAARMRVASLRSGYYGYWVTTR